MKLYKPRAYNWHFTVVQFIKLEGNCMYVFRNPDEIYVQVLLDSFRRVILKRGHKKDKLLFELLYQECFSTSVLQ